MKKRILSTVLAATMLLSSSIAAFAVEITEPDAAKFYEGNTPFVSAEKILDELNADAASDIFDKIQHGNQLAAIKDVNSYLASKKYTDAEILEKLDACIDLLCADSRMTDYKKQYLVALVKAYDGGNSELATKLENTNNTENMTLRESFGELDKYIDNMQKIFNEYSISKYDYNLEKAKQYVAEPLFAILKIMFAQAGTADSYDDSGKYMRENYYDKFLTEDRTKKTLAVLFGADLTEEIVSDSVTSDKGIVRHVKNYINNDASKITDIKNDLGKVMVEGKKEAVEEAFDLLGTIVDKAYENNAKMHGDVTMLMGNGTKEGLIELLIKAVDNADLDASNIWINLLLSEFIQMYHLNVPLANVSAATPNPTPEKIEDETYLTFKNKGLSAYGIADGALPLGTGYFDVKCYIGNEINDKVTYSSSDGKINVEKDSSKGTEYDAYLVLYRESADGGVSTFIESYPVTIVNEEKSDYVPSGNGGGVRRYTVTYESNGGTVFTADTYSKGATIELTKVPKKDGYVFGGWYLDAALTQPAKSIVMNSSITVYAAWVKDGGSVVSKVEIPEMLNGGEHFAYVVGYPEGDVRPQANITRAETVTILFRLLKDDVRKANITEENIFTDVNSGDWYNTAVSTLAALDIVNGRTETEFMPNEYITRAEFATIFARFAEYAYDRAEQFTDISGHWAEKNILEVTAYGWIAGYENNTFRPDNRITRAEAMTLINRVLKRVPENKDDLLEGMNVWSDNTDTSAWYYIAIQEATNSHEFTMKNDSNETWTKLTANKDWTEYEK